jgi:DNA polymerase-3 subunit beta
MKFMCSKQNLLEGINIVKTAVSTKTTLSILEGILIQTNEDSKSIKLIVNYI